MKSHKTILLKNPNKIHREKYNLYFIDDFTSTMFVTNVIIVQRVINTCTESQEQIQRHHRPNDYLP